MCQVLAGPGQDPRTSALHKNAPQPKVMDGSEVLSPGLVQLRELATKLFLSPEGQNIEELLDCVRQAVNSVGLRNKSVVDTTHLLLSKPLSAIIDQAEIPQDSIDPQVILSSLGANTTGSVFASDPLTAKNIIPLPSFPSLASHLAVSLLMANGVSGEDSGRILNAEIACSAALAKLVGYNPATSAGMFTFGGTGTNMYGGKLGLFKVAPDHHRLGIPSDICFVTTRSAHYSHDTVGAWLGVGSNNCVRVSVNEDQTTNLQDLNKICRELLSAGKKIAAIFASGGTTSNCAIDDVGKVAELRDNLVADFKLNYKPHIHLDSVLGWAFLSFKDYDLVHNKLGFSDPVVMQIARFQTLMRSFQAADSVGIDFHKTGFVPYNSSMFIARDAKDIQAMVRDGASTTPLFHDEQAYNPGRFTLETSRSSATILSTWVGLQSLGINGFQLILGNALENSWTLRNAISENSQRGFVTVNKQPFGCDVFIRCYESNIDGEAEFAKERHDVERRKINTDYLIKFYKFLTQTRNNGEGRFSVSKSTAAFYYNGNEPVQAIRIYSLNPYASRSTMLELAKRLVDAKIEFDSIT